MCDKNYYEIRAGKCQFAQIQNGRIYCTNQNCKESYHYKKSQIMKNLKVFEIESGETFFVCHYSADEAKDWFIKYQYIRSEDVESVKEIPNENWSDFKILDTDAELDEDGQYPVLETFAQFMQTATEPVIMCSSDF